MRSSFPTIGDKESVPSLVANVVSSYDYSRLGTQLCISRRNLHLPYQMLLGSSSSIDTYFMLVCFNLPLLIALVHASDSCSVPLF